MDMPSQFEAGQEDGDRFRSLTDLKWGKFESLGFGGLGQEKLTEQSAKRPVLSWNDPSPIGFTRSDITPLSVTLQFPPPMSTTISSYQPAEYAKKLKMAAKHILVFGWDTEPVIEFQPDAVLLFDEFVPLEYRQQISSSSSGSSQLPPAEYSSVDFETRLASLDGEDVYEDYPPIDGMPKKREDRGEDVDPVSLEVQKVLKGVRKMSQSPESQRTEKVPVGDEEEESIGFERVPSRLGMNDYVDDPRHPQYYDDSLDYDADGPSMTEQLIQSLHYDQHEFEDDEPEPVVEVEEEKEELPPRPCILMAMATSPRALPTPMVMLKIVMTLAQKEAEEEEEVLPPPHVPLIGEDQGHMSLGQYVHGALVHNVLEEEEEE
ncbi:uncharacterized protein EV420DRAFT_1483290 [Desarmillaria tabescens]|uniref:Uncharacterized protein n=1 Tax=Armillaria tabescens TaxID=1929756 RepID=A0AA39JUD0_ARMTA|nr:uncharacterized protein EV420DRAFT_1483290 [Desarmillaria tabescens]KAK0449095.1 hypothetical protein EV420DRAFT_1483290 [Desarmillaria tabescens]